MRIIRVPVEIIGDNRRPLLLLNVMAYGLLLLGIAAGMLFPQLHHARVASMGASGDTALVVSLLSRPWLFAMTIFAVNTIRIALLTIFLPSLVVPFAGIALFAYFAVTTGITLAPLDRNAALTLIPHSLTVVIEFQAYILMMLGAFLLGRCWLRPAQVGADTRHQGYLRGLQHLGWLVLPALALFVIGAIYEAFSITRLVPLLVAR